MDRSAVIVLQNPHVALIERVREGRTYYLFPGGGIKENETSAQAAVREAREELGVDVTLHGLAASVTFAGNKQYFYAATIIAGAFGNGTGAEFTASPTAEKGSYRPVWLPLSDLTVCGVRPQALAHALVTQSYPFVTPLHFNEC